MGERDPGLRPAEPPPPWPQRGLLAAPLVALGAAVLALGPVPPVVEAPPAALATGALEAALRVPAGERGEALLGVLLLALAALFGCRALEPRVGRQAPLLVVLLIFGSGAWAMVWTAGAALAPLALAVIAFSLAYGGGAAEGPTEIYRPLEPARRSVPRWLAVGLLLAELVPSNPLAAGLLLPAALAVPRERRSTLLPTLLVGFTAALAVELAVRGPAPFSQPIALAAASVHSDPILLARGLQGLLAGRNVGLLAGFLPALLLLLLGRGAAARPGLAATCVTLPILGALLLPFDYAAGWLNVAFLPVYGALWHLPVRPPRPWQWGATAALALLLAWPLWVAPRAALEEAGTRLAGAWPRRHLPYESTLRRLPNRGEADFPAEGIRVRAVAGCRLLGDSGRLELDGAGPAVLWLAAPGELERLALESGPGAPSSFEVAGATAGRTVFRPDGRVGFELLLERPLGNHRLWFGEEPMGVHLVELELSGREEAGPLRFRLLARPQP